MPCQGAWKFEYKLSLDVGERGVKEFIHSQKAGPLHPHRDLWPPFHVSVGSHCPHAHTQEISGHRSRCPASWQCSKVWAFGPVRELACEMRVLGFPAHLASGITDLAKEKFPTQRPTRNWTCVR